MTVASETPINTYTANGSTTVFAYTFRIEDASEIKIYHNEVEQTSGFSVSGIGVNGGGSVTYTTAPASGTAILFLRDMPATRTIDYQNSGDFRAETINEDLDRLWLKVQQVKRDLDYRGLQFAESQNRTPSINALPAPSVNRVLKWDSDGSLVNSDIQNLVTNVNLSSTVDRYDDLAEFISSTPTTDTVYITGYYAGWAATSKGPKGGHERYKTGSTNASPSRGTAVSVSQIGGGDGTGSTTGQAVQTGLCWDANGDEWETVHNTVYQIERYGAKDSDSSFDNSVVFNGIMAAYFQQGGEIVVPAKNWYISNTIEIRPHFLINGKVSSVNVGGEGTRITLADASDCDVIRTYTTSGWPITDVNDYFVGGGVTNLMINANKNGQSTTFNQNTGAVITAVNDPTTGELPCGIKMHRWIELSRIDNVLVGNAVGHGIRVEASSLPIIGRNISIGSSGVAALSIGDFVSATQWDNVSASNNPVVVEFDAQVADISGHVFNNPHFEQNGVGFQFANASVAPVTLFNHTNWGRQVAGFSGTAGSPSCTCTASDLRLWMAGKKIKIPGAGSGGSELVANVSSLDLGTGAVTLDTNILTTVSSVTAEAGCLYEYAASRPGLISINPSFREIACFIDNNGTPIEKTQTEVSLYIERTGLEFGEGGQIEHEAYTDATLAGTWANSGGTSANLSYLKTPGGLVQLKGNVTSGGSGTTITTLPTGYRPAHRLYFSVFNIGSATVATVYVDTNGDVVHVSGSTTSITFDAVNFTI